MYDSPNTQHSPKSYNSSLGERQRKKRAGPPVWSRFRYCCQRRLLFLVRVCGLVKSVLCLLCPCLGKRSSGYMASSSPTAASLRGRDITPLNAQTASEFPDNTVINSRYTIFNFIFKNLYEQFRRPLNFYFLLVALLQFISIIAPVNPMSTLLPLLFAFSLTAVKEGYDDVKRHRQDTAYNTKRRLILDRVTGQWRQTTNASIRLGDVILLHQNDEIPCDCLVLAAPAASVFIRTDNLDGEIDLKPRDTVAPLVEPTYTAPTPPPSQSTGYDKAYGNAGGDVGYPSPTSPLRLPSPSSQPPTFFSLDDDGPALLEKLDCLTVRCPPPNGIVDSFDGVAQFVRRELVASPVRLVSPAAAAAARFPASHDVGGGMEEMGEEVIRVSLSHRHLLPQSCLLKNTERAICLAVYTGNETKCGMNKRPPPVKWANIDKNVSRYSVYIFCCQIISAIAFGVSGYVSNHHVERTHWYLPPPVSEKSGSFLIYPLRFFLLTTVMIPVSFKFVVDMSKYYMALSVEWDESMVHGEQLGGCKVNNSSILEDLGQIDYVLSDKTGTMTQNVMELQCISVVPDVQLNLAEVELPPSVFTSPTVAHRGCGRAADGTELTRTPPPASSAQQSSEVQHFASVLALCNTVEVTSAADSRQGLSPTSSAIVDGEGVTYQAASPDEGALCCGAAKLNVVLYRRSLHEAVLRVSTIDDGTSVTVTTPTARSMATAATTTRDDVWLIHHVFQFSSERKAMGVIVEHKQRRRILFLVKGADDSVAKMLRGAPGKSPSTDHLSGPLQLTWQETYPSMADHLRGYAKRGLRTLLVAQRVLDRQELNEFLVAHRQAELAMENRQEKMEALRTALETDLELVGITAIEDKLQEQVQETIADILNAGMMLWMLTGDKVETAEQIGLSCGLYGPRDRVLRIVEGDSEETRGSWEDTLLHADLPVPHGRTATSVAYGGPSKVHPWRHLAVEEKQARLALGRRVIQRVRTFGLATGDVREEEVEEAAANASTVVAGSGARPDSPVEQTFFTPSSSAPPQRTVLVVQGGEVLERIIATPHLAARFGELSRRSVSVICARTTPSQKAMVTQFVRQQGKMTLSIGDGGNDVAMIQEAHVGVGIAGKEGQQAARAADFAVTRFSDLRQLLFVHGQQAYVRTAYVIKYSFYKSMLISFIQLAYNLTATHVSGGTFWNSFSLTMWNGMYTLPQTLFYCLDRVAPRVVLERCPWLYKLTRRAVDMDVKEFFGWYVLRGVLQSVGLLVLVSSVLGGPFAFRTHGYASSNDINFSVAYSALIVSQMITVFLESHSVTGLNVFWLVGMPAFYIGSTLAYSDIPQLQYYGVLRKTLGLEFWLAILAIATVLTMPVVILQGFREAWTPNVRDVLRRAELKRQKMLMKRPVYRRKQSFWARFLGCTPEAPSPSLRTDASRGMVPGVANRYAGISDGGGGGGGATRVTDIAIAVAANDNRDTGPREV